MLSVASGDQIHQSLLLSGLCSVKVHCYGLISATDGRATVVMKARGSAVLTLRAGSALGADRGSVRPSTGESACQAHDVPTAAT
jgi:hypothetical protein